MEIFIALISLIIIYIIFVSYIYFHNIYIIKKYNIIFFKELNKKIKQDNYYEYFLNNRNISKNDALYDIRFLKKIILKIHPDPYFFISKEQFDNIFKQAEKEIEKAEKIDSISFFKIVNKTICSLRDVHSSQFIMENIFFKYLYNYKKLFPAKVFIDNDNNVYLLDFVDDEQKKILIEKIALKQNIKKDKVNLKNYKIKIVSINEIKISDILDYLSDYENLYKKQMRIKKLNYYLFSYFEFINKLYYLFGDIDIYNTKVYVEDLDLSFNLKIKSKNLKRDKKISSILSNNFYKINLFLKSKGFESYYENENLLMSINYDKKIAYLKINYFDFFNFDFLLNYKTLKRYILNRFNKDYFEKYSYLNEEPFITYRIMKHFNDFFKTIKEKEIKYLLIDIKNNPGGNSFCSDFLIDILFKIKNIDNKNFHIINKNKDKNKKEIKINKNVNKNVLILAHENLGYTFINYLLNFIKAKFYYKICDNIKEWFFKNIIKNVDQDKDLKVYLIQNSNIASSTKYFSCLFKKYNFGKIIGEESADIIRGTGNFAYFILPETKLIYNLALSIIQRENIFHGVLPDIEVHQNIDDLLKEKDTILESTLNLIEKERE